MILSRLNEHESINSLLADMAGEDFILLALEKQDEESLLDEESKEESVLALKIDIVKHIVAIRLQGRAEAEAKKDRAERKQVLLGILAEKKSEELRSMSTEDLTKLINEL